MRTIVVLALWLLAGWNLGAVLEFATGLPTWLGIVGGLGVGLFAARSTPRNSTAQLLTPDHLSLHRQ